MADEILDGPHMMGQFFGEGERVTHQPRDALSQGVIETLHMIGFAGVFRDRFVPLCWNHPCIGVVLIRIERRLRAVRLRQVRPQLFRAVTAAIRRCSLDSSGDRERGTVGRCAVPPACGTRCIDPSRVG